MSPVSNPLFARLYARSMVQRADRKAGQAEHRRELLHGLSGRVVELGAGNGLNFGHYPATVEKVVAVEPEPFLRARAQEAATRAEVPVRVVDGVADELPDAAPESRPGERDRGPARRRLRRGWRGGQGAQRRQGQRP